jgi:hypothetical protein
MVSSLLACHDGTPGTLTQAPNTIRLRIIYQNAQFYDQSCFRMFCGNSTIMVTISSNGQCFGSEPSMHAEVEKIGYSIVLAYEYNRYGDK